MEIPNFAKIYFLCAGIGALISWNSILTALDFFSDKFPFNVPFLFGIPLFISTNIFSYLIYIIARYISLNTRIFGGFLVMAIVVVFMPVLAVILPNEEGFYLTLGLIFILGIANSVMQGSTVSLAAMFPYECLSLYFTGTGFAGIIICLLRMLMLISFGSEDKKGIVIGTVVYFSISAAFLLFTMFMHLFFIKTEFCKFYLKQAKGKMSGNIQGKKIELAISPEGNLGEETLLYGGNAEEEISVISHEVYNHDWKFISGVFKKIMPLPFIVGLIYVQTFMMFPGVSLKKEISGISKAWNATILIFVFNVFDTIGKYFSSWRRFYSKKSTIYLVLIRFVFFAFFLLMAGRDDIAIISDDWFAIVNIALFSLFNGYTTSCSMVLAPEECENEEKETAGFLMTHPLYLGIMVGTFLALFFEGI